MITRPIRVLFVCMGNICRSPTAEGVFAHLVTKRGLTDRIQHDSAGTGAWHVGEAPDARAQAAARKHGIDISRQRARAVRSSDFSRFDYICAMDQDNLQILKRKCPANLRDRVHLFCDFAKGLEGGSVPDPFYGGEDGFDAVFTMVNRASDGLIESIVKKHLSEDVAGD